jgi:hypothetical protein
MDVRVAGTTFALSAFGFLSGSIASGEIVLGERVDKGVAVQIPAQPLPSSPTAWNLTTFAAVSTYVPAALVAEAMGRLAADSVSRHVFFNRSASDLAVAAIHSCLERYSALKDGWDGPGSKAPDGRSLQLLGDLIDSLPPSVPVPKAMLSKTGELGLYWDEARRFADLILEEGGLFSIFVRDKASGREKFAAEIAPERLVGETLEEYLGGMSKA